LPNKKLAAFHTAPSAVVEADAEVNETSCPHRKWKDSEGGGEEEVEEHVEPGAGVDDSGGPEGGGLGDGLGDDMAEMRRKMWA
jgi:hypothetical protein